MNTATEEDKQSRNIPSKKINFDNQLSEIDQFYNLSLDHRNHTVSSSNDSNEVVTCEAENTSQFTSIQLAFRNSADGGKRKKDHSPG